jgi:sodium/hydrogen antiporter
VINRDLANLVERGQASEAVKDGLTDTTGLEEDEKRDRLPREDSADADTLTVATTKPEEAKADNVPDGMEIFAEWKEGPHRIIERRIGPGEEVRLSS